MSGTSISSGTRPSFTGAEDVRAVLDWLHTEIDHRYEHLYEQARALSIDENELDSSDSALLPKHCSRCATFPIAQDEIGRCTSTASLIASKLKGRVMGYRCAPAIGASLGEGEGRGGHDFAVIGGRFIADWWANSYRDLPDLHDLSDSRDQGVIRKLYGDARRWTVLFDFSRSRQSPTPRRSMNQVLAHRQR